jgi:hypothetical protein
MMATPDVKTTLTLDQMDGIGTKLDELRTLISLLVAASTGQDTYDEVGFSLMMEDKFAELYDIYHEAIGEESRYQRFSTR